MKSIPNKKNLHYRSKSHANATLYRHIEIDLESLNNVVQFVTNID